MKKHFAENLKALRKEYGLTQTELANKLFIHKSMISCYEKSQKLPSLDIIIKIADEFNISIDRLLSIEKDNLNDIPQTINISGLTQKQVSIVSEIIEAFRDQN